MGIRAARARSLAPLVKARGLRDDDGVGFRLFRGKPHFSQRTREMGHPPFPARSVAPIKVKTSPMYTCAMRMMCAAILSFLITAGSGSAQLPTAAAPGKIIIDTDIGDDVDDAFALALALKSPEVQILGITATF